MTATPSRQRAAIPRGAKPLVLTAQDVNDTVRGQLSQLGINISAAAVQAILREVKAGGIAMDDNLGTLTTASITTPVQFLQTWLPGFVRVMTQARKIDQLIGLSIVGNWEDEEIVQGVIENTAYAVPYADSSNVPLAGWNVNFERRTVLRFESGIQVGVLEESRAARIRANTAQEKRNGASLTLEINRNRIGFFGYNGGANRTYGFLNDPSLPNYVNVPNGAAAQPTWASKTFQEIIKDIRTAVQALRVASGDNYDPRKDAAVLAVATAASEFMGTTTDFGKSVADWIEETYPAITVETAPELNAANGGANVGYLYRESVDDGASDDNRVWVQLVPAKFQTIGVAKAAKGYVEDYSNAVAGVMCKRPYAVYRFSGI